LKTIYNTTGTCSSQIAIELEDDVIKEVQFSGGCGGNLDGISTLVKGMRVSDVIEKLEGTKCGTRKSSCPDQLVQALKEMVK